MSHYEQAFDEWESLEEDEAVDRAYALGVAAALGEYHQEELEAIREQMGSAYSKSVVDLAFEEGKNEGREIAVGDDDKQVWAELVEGEKATVDEDDLPTGGQTGLTGAVEKVDVLDKPERDSTDVVDLPDFLEK